MDELKTSQVDLVDAARLDALCESARNSPRRRAHLLLHSGHGDQVQRLLIAAEPGTYVRAHRHSEQWEMLVLLRGRLDLLLLSDEAEVEQRVTLSGLSSVVQIPMGRCHCAVSREAGTLVMEIKPGPYRPNEFMAWAPEEDGAKAAAFLHWATGAEVGRAWSGAALA